MGLCILIGQHCHVLNHQTLMNHFPFGRERKKSIGLPPDIVPALHKAHNVDTHRSTWTPPRLLICTPRSSRFCPSVCVSSLCLSPSIFLTSAIPPCVLHSSYFSWRLAGGGSKYPSPQTADPEWPCNPFCLWCLSQGLSFQGPCDAALW